MRIRDKIFPEGTFRRKILRICAHIIKGFKPHNIRTTINLIKEEGIVKTINEIKIIIFGKVEYEDINKTYQEWIKHNEPTKKKSKNNEIQNLKLT